MKKNTFEEMKKIGDRVLKAYKGDLEIDRETLSRMKDGEHGVWKCYHAGTHLLRVGKDHAEFNRAVLDCYNFSGCRYFEFYKNISFKEIRAGKKFTKMERVKFIIEDMAHEKTSDKVG